MKKLLLATILIVVAISLVGCVRTITWDDSVFQVVFFFYFGTEIPTLNNLQDGQLIPEPANPTRPAATFEGWYMDRGFTTPFNFDTMRVNESITLYARWGFHYYTITYVLNGGTNHPNNRPEFSLHSHPFILGYPTRTGFIFGGWFTSPTFEDATRIFEINPNPETGTVPLEDLTLYARWSVVRSIVTLRLDQGAAVWDRVEFFSGQEFSIDTVPTREGYSFVGFFLIQGTNETQLINADGSGIGLWTITGNVTLYARWTPSP
jgi:uncharacterized repeat protein (TIGR02543 family)